LCKSQGHDAPSVLELTAVPSSLRYFASPTSYRQLARWRPLGQSATQRFSNDTRQEQRKQPPQLQQHEELAAMSFEKAKQVDTKKLQRSTALFSSEYLVFNLNLFSCQLTHDTQGRKMQPPSTSGGSIFRTTQRGTFGYRTKRFWLRPHSVETSTPRNSCPRSVHQTTRKLRIRPPNRQAGAVVSAAKWIFRLRRSRSRGAKLRRWRDLVCRIKPPKAISLLQAA